eukprot:1162166-Amphidinium_carterae.3
MYAFCNWSPFPWNLAVLLGRSRPARDLDEKLERDTGRHMAGGAGQELDRGGHRCQVKLVR